MIKKWKLLNSEFVLDEKWYRVRKDTVEIKPGQVIDDYYLGVFNDIVIVVVLTPDRQVPLVRQYKHGAGEIITELPAGYMNDGEEPLEAAKRELREETGFTSSDWHSLGVFCKNPTKSTGDNIYLFLALNAEKTSDQKLDETENIEVLLTPFNDVVSQAWTGSIEAVDSAMAVLLAEKKLGKDGNSK